MFRWVRARTAKEKLDISFSYGKYSWGPGEVLRYNSTQTFVLAAAMDSFLKRREGPKAHLWDMVVSEVFHPIGIFHAPMMHTAEADGERGIPLLAFWSLPDHRRYRQIDHTVAERRPLSGPPTAQCCEVGRSVVQDQRQWVCRPERRTGSAMRDTICRSGPTPYRTDDGCFFQIPVHGGVWRQSRRAVYPTVISAFRFADGFNFDVEAMVLAGESLRPFCSTAAEQTPPSVKRQPLTASELNTVFSGHTFYGDGWRMFAAA